MTYPYADFDLASFLVSSEPDSEDEPLLGVGFLSAQAQPCFLENAQVAVELDAAALSQAAQLANLQVEMVQLQSQQLALLQLTAQDSAAPELYQALEMQIQLLQEEIDALCE